MAEIKRMSGAGGAEERALSERALSVLKGMLPGSGEEDAITLLKRDHDEVEALFDEFFRMQDGGERAERGRIAAEVCALLTVHAQIEEELLYPRARRDVADAQELVKEATVEHSTLKALIARLQAMTPDDEMFDATFQVLTEYVKHHVKEEEGELFPRIKASDVDLDALGRALEARKLELLTAVAASN